MLRGGCLCGAVRYEIRAAPWTMYHCHCGTCRKASGASFATNLVVAADDFVVVAGADALGAWESSPGKRRHFCRTCGSPIFSRGEATKAIVSVRAGTVDGDPGLRPSVHAYVASKAPWTDIRDDLAQKPESFA